MAVRSGVPDGDDDRTEAEPPDLGSLPSAPSSFTTRASPLAGSSDQGGTSDTTKFSPALPVGFTIAGAPASAMDGPEGAIAPGQVLFDLYRVKQLIGRGGMGEVWLVDHLDLECARALKLIDAKIAADPEIRRRFQVEAKAGARLNHANAVSVHHMKLTPAAAFIEMEYVQGRSLTQLLTPGEPMPLDWVARLIVQLCDVLQVAHDHKIVHRDLKPSNLMLLDGRPVGREHLKVLDFGIAKLLETEGVPGSEELTRPGLFLGTILYTSPEQATNGPVDARTDLYTVGVILYELLTGHRPFTGPGAMHGHACLPPVPLNQTNPNARVPAKVEAVVLRCLAKNRDDRPQSALELAREFLAAAEGHALVSGRSEIWNSEARAASRSPLHTAPTQRGPESGDFEVQQSPTQSEGGPGLSASTMTDLPGRGDPGYEILQRIGESPAAIVFKAREGKQGRLVAIKELCEGARGDPVWNDRFWQEARALTRLEHDHIVRVYEVIEPRRWIVMELMTGSLVTRIIDRPLKPDQVRSVLRQALSALQFLHQMDRLHGAIKPSNLLYDERGRVKLGDALGLIPDASDVGATGKAKYQVPERMSPRFGTIGPAFDLYSLGFTAYELLTGPNFGRLFPGVEGDPHDAARAWHFWHGSASTRLPPLSEILPGVDQDVARVVDRLVVKDVIARYPDAQTALGDLENQPVVKLDPVVSPSPAPAPSMPSPSPSPSPSPAPTPRADELPPAPFPALAAASTGRRSSKLLLVVPAVLAVLGAVLYFGFLGGSDTPIVPTQKVSGDAVQGPLPDLTKPTRPVVDESSTPDRVPGVEARSKGEAEPEKPKVPGHTVPETPVVPVVSIPKPQDPPPKPVEAEVVVQPPPELTLKTVNLKLVLIPRGKFLMGSPAGAGDPNEHPQHEVTITGPFYLGQTEVTQEQYEQVMGVNPSYFSRTGRGAKRVAGSETKAHPVEQVGYDGALEFCRRLAQREGLPEGSIQLPTEARWEYAARANSDEAPVLGEALNALAWYHGNAEDRTHPVAQKGPNAFRLFDMAGNVREWCRDWYGDLYPDTPQRDPIGPEKPAETALRVLRGGSWVESDRACRATDRSGAEPDEPTNHYGFRIAVDTESVRPLFPPPPPR